MFFDILVSPYCCTSYKTHLIQRIKENKGLGFVSVFQCMRHDNVLFVFSFRELFLFCFAMVINYDVLRLE